MHFGGLSLDGPFVSNLCFPLAAKANKLPALSIQHGCDRQCARFMKRARNEVEISAMQIYTNLRQILDTFGTHVLLNVRMFYWLLGCGLIVQDPIDISY